MSFGISQMAANFACNLSNAEKVNKKPWHLEDLANGEYDPFKLNSSLEVGSPALISVGLNSFVVSR